VKRKLLPGVFALFLLLLAGCGGTQKVVVPVQQQYVGSINSTKYHLPNCQWAENIKPENEIWFSSIEETQKAGYKPCKTCQPQPKH
jgi:hypothetical protein